MELDPNNKQRTALLKHAGAARFAWNWALAQRKLEYKTTGKSSNAIEQSRQLNAIKTIAFPWMYEVSKWAPQSAIQNLDRAYQNFWRGLNNKHVGFPKFKSKKNGIGSFCIADGIRVNKDTIKLPKLGRIQLKEHGYIPIFGIRILSAVCSEKAGHWFVSVNCEQEIPNALPESGNVLGVDLGIKTLATVSDGRKFENPKALGRNLKKLRRLQREFSRRKKGSANREKTKHTLSKLHYHIANIRKDTLHKATSAICAKSKPDSERPNVIVIEDLSVSKMLSEHRLARAISDVGFGEFRRQLTYKTAWCGEKLIVADRFFPSSKLCSNCGFINNNLVLADREWTCTNCSAFHSRDLNAAINLESLAKINTVSSTEIDACGDYVRPDSHSGDYQGSRNQTSKNLVLSKF